MTRILAIGDIMGKAGRRCLSTLLPKARAQFHPDVVIVNGENTAGGFGITQKIYQQLTEQLEVDCVTTGNHWHDKREIHDFIGDAERLVIPANMSNVDNPEMGLTVITSRSGKRIAVINLIGRAFMHGDNDCPFKTADKLLSLVPDTIKIRVVDMHAEATSEKQGLGRYLAGRASLVYGTHSHVPTADERILDRKTGYTTDLGMTGAYDSVIGIRTESALNRFLTGERKKFEPASSNPWLCAVIADIDDVTGHCQEIQRIRWEQDKFDENQA